MIKPHDTKKPPKKKLLTTGRTEERKNINLDDIGNETKEDVDSQEEIDEECAVCKATTEDENLVGCWECECWIHVKCANITDLEFKILRLGSKEIEYVCKNCKKLKKESRRAKDELRNENRKLKEMNSELNVRYEKIVLEQGSTILGMLGFLFLYYYTKQMIIL